MNQNQEYLMIRSSILISNKYANNDILQCNFCETGKIFEQRL